MGDDGMETIEQFVVFVSEAASFLTFSSCLFNRLPLNVSFVGVSVIFVVVCKSTLLTGECVFTLGDKTFSLFESKTNN